MAKKELTQVSFIEPDFEFKFYPNKKGSYYIEWQFNLWNGGVLTCNSFVLTLCDDDINVLLKYLEEVMMEEK